MSYWVQMVRNSHWDTVNDIDQEVSSRLFLNYRQSIFSSDFNNEVTFPTKKSNIQRKGRIQNPDQVEYTEHSCQIVLCGTRRKRPFLNN